MECQLKYALLKKGQEIKFSTFMIIRKGKQRIIVRLRYLIYEISVKMVSIYFFYLLLVQIR